MRDVFLQMHCHNYHSHFQLFSGDLGKATSGVSPDQLETLPVDVVSLEAPETPDPVVSPPQSTNEKRMVYQSRGAQLPVQDSATKKLEQQQPNIEKKLEDEFTQSDDEVGMVLQFLWACFHINVVLICFHNLSYIIFNLVNILRHTHVYH